MRGAVLFPMLLLLPILAGCLGGSDGPPRGQATPGYATAIEAAYDAEVFQTARAADDDRWFLLSTPTSPEGTVAGFKWAIPEELRQSSGERLIPVVLEVAPLVDDALRADQEWALFLFSDLPELGGLFPTSVVLAPALRGTAWSGTASNDASAVPASAPLLQIAAVPTTGHLYIVLAAKGAPDEAFGLGVRARIHDPNEGLGVPPADLGAFLTAQGNRAPYVPARVGSGTGLVLDSYVSTLGPLSGRVTTTGAMEVVDSSPLGARPGISARDLTLRSTGNDAGWGLIEGLYAGSSGVGLWASDIDHYGAHADGNSVVLSAGPATTAFSPLVGVPLFLALGEGIGGSTVTFDLDAVHVNIAEELIVLNVGLGVPLSALLGPPAATLAGVGTGALGNIPPTELRWAHDRLTLTGGAGPRTIGLPLAAGGPLAPT